MSRTRSNLLTLIIFLFLLLAAPAAQATLILEPVFNRVAGSGPGADTFPLYDLTFLNGLTGEPFQTADEPGEIVSFPAGVPRDEENVEDVRFFNNTAYNITGFTWTLVGTAVEPEPYAFAITRDPTVDAIFGDANGDGLVGLSDIFATISVSPDGRSITFTDGLIPIGGRFTDYIFSTTTDGLPFLAAVDASFTGVQPVPEPSAILLLGGALLVVAVGRRLRR